MKKSLLFISAIIASSLGYAQTVTVPNNGFESWSYYPSAANLDNWSDTITTVTTASLNGTYYSGPTATSYRTADSVISPDANSGAKSIVVHSVATTMSGIAVVIPGAMVSGDNALATITSNVNVTGSFPTFALNTVGTPTVSIQGNIPFNNKLAPSGLKGYYKYKSDSAITGNISIILFGGASHKDTVGFYLDQAMAMTNTVDAASYSLAKQSTWTAFSFSLSPNVLKGATSIPETIDSARIIVMTCLPSQLLANKSSAVDSVFLDQLEFTYFVPAPTITITGNTLTSSSSTGNQWYKDGVAIAGATSSTYYAGSVLGVYTDVVTKEGVSSAVSNAINYSVVAVSSVTEPNGFVLSQNVPNPFSGTTSISFSTPNAGTVQFTVVDMLGRIVNSQTVNASAGINTITYSASDSGTYFYTISDGAHTVTKKLVVYK